MSYSLSRIKSVLKGTFWVKFSTLPEQANIEKQDIEHLLIDSRKISFPDKSLFFAIIGERHDGHDFITDVYKSGVRAFVVSDIEKLNKSTFDGAVFIQVADVLKALQALAAYHRSQFPNLKVIGITGSNGKTIVKEWLYQLLKDRHNVVRSPKSYNSQVGVPLSVWQINEIHEVAIFEAGISTTDEMKVLASIIQPTIGVFTNLGEAHTEGFISDEEKINEKFQLFKNSQVIVCQQDILIRFPHLVHNNQFICWSKKGQADACITDIQYQKNKTTFVLKFKDAQWDINIPFSDAASVENVTSCILAFCVVEYYHSTPPSVFDPIAQKWSTFLVKHKQSLLDKLKYLEPIAMRLELKAGINNCLVVNDSYNLDINAVQIALDFIAQQSRQLKRTVILSDFLQTGQEAHTFYKKVAYILLEKGISKVIGIGSSIFEIEKYISNKLDCQFYANTNDFLHNLKNSDFNKEIILLKGARAFAFERIAERLSLKSHKTVLEINLNALTHNLAVFKTLIRAGKPHAPTKLMAMVKASAYGNGSEEVARLLEFHKVDYLAVAYSDEGIVLRQAGVKMPIMVMNPDEESFDAMYRYNLEPEIYSLNILNRLIEFSYYAKSPTPYSIHLKLDTGMHRLGFEKTNIAELVSLINQNKHITIISVFTHLAASESPEHDSFTHEQVRRFMEMYDVLTEGVGYKPMRHVLNSSGIVRHASYQFEMARLGIGLYGIDSSGLFQNNLQVVQTLKASISQIKNVACHETIGYSRRGALTRDSRIATISIGYADGLLRGAGNGRFSVWVKGQLAPIVGNVCMDMTMIDITDIPEALEGDEVEIFGTHISVHQLATVLDTIPYQIFTGIAERVKRVYFQE